MLVGYCFNLREPFFLEYSVPLFQEGSCDHPFLNRYGVFYNSTCSCELCIYNVFDRYFFLTAYCYFKGALGATHLSGNIIISGGHLQWSSIFKGTGFLWKKIFRGIELIRNSSCSHAFDELPFINFKKVISATHSFKFTVLFQKRNCSKRIS